MDLRSALAFEYARILAVVHATDALFLFLSSYVMCRHMMFFTTDPPSEITSRKAVAMAIISFQLSFLICLAYASKYATSDRLFSCFIKVFGTSTLISIGVLSSVSTPSLVAGWCACVFVAAISASRFVHIDTGCGLLSAVLSCIMVSMMTKQIIFPEGISIGAAASHVVAHRVVEYVGGHFAVDMAYKSHRSITVEDRQVMVFPRGRGSLIDLISGLACGLIAGPLVWFFHHLFNAFFLLVPRPYSSIAIYLMAGFSGCLCAGILTFVGADVEGDEDSDYGDRGGALSLGVLNVHA